MTHDARLRALAARNPLNRLLQGTASRRQFLQGMGAGLAAAGALPLAARAQAARPLSLLTWDAYADPRLLDLWRSVSGEDVRYEIHISDPTSVNRLRAGETAIWDFINLNNPWARQVLWPEGLIVDLPRERFEPLYQEMFPKFHLPYPWAMSEDGEHLLGVVQRFETFDFVVNSDVIDPETAKDEGWDLFNNPHFQGRFGILAYEDWNVMDICMGAGVHPFKVKTDEEVARFEETANRWIQNAALITTDFVQLNQAMLNGEIDLYFTGGTYTTAAARLEGLTNLYAITPRSGPRTVRAGSTGSRSTRRQQPRLPSRRSRLPRVHHHGGRGRDRRTRQRQPPAGEPDGQPRANGPLLGRGARRHPVGRVRRAHRQRSRVRHRARLRPAVRHLLRRDARAGLRMAPEGALARPVILSLQGLSKTFDGLRAVDDVSLDIPEGSS
jgi:spermidine/putrescine transport system substrate-binding protein